MQNVSDNWKNSHQRTILNETFVEVSLNIGDPDALAAASAQDNGAIYISDSSKLLSEEDKKPTSYCTLEQNLWCLDGNRKAIPESDFGETGYVSDVLSDDTCIFSGRKPTITITFNAVFSKLIPGVTIVWSNTYDEYPDTFTVRAYNGSILKVEKEVTGNRSVKTIVFADIVDYNKIEIVVNKWCLPNHRARVEEIYVGLNKVYGKGDLFEFSHSQSVDLLSTSLPKFEIKFTVANTEGEYNPLNASGFSKYLTERQEVKARYGMRKDDGSIEWIKGGTFYLSEWYAKQNGITAEFTARDLLEFMFDIYEDTEYYDYVEDNVAVGDTITYSRSLYDLAVKVLNKAGISADKYVIDVSLRNINTTAPLPQDTLAACLQLIANAGGCVLYQDRNGVLRIEPRSKVVSGDYVINSFNSYTKPEITLSKPMYCLTIMEYSYAKGSNGVESDSRKFEWVPYQDIAGETITIDNPLITAETNDMSEWMINIYLRRMMIEASWRADVRLDALDMIQVENDYDTNTVIITDIDFKYNGAFRGTCKGRVNKLV
jgi:hypothetical protein